MHSKSISFTLIILSGLIFCSCAATTQMMPERADLAAKQFTPIPHKANLYVTRTSALGNAVLFQIYLDGKHTGAIAVKTFLLFEVEPGKHQVAVITKESQSALIMDLEKGDNCFIEVVPKWGMMEARAELKELSPEEGRQNVLKSKRAESLFFRP